MAPKKRIGEMLLEAGVIDETQLKAALGHQRQWGMRLGQALVEMNLAAEADIVAVLAAKLGVDVANLDAVDPHAQAEALRLLSRDFAVRHGVLPLAADTGTITVATGDPTNLAVIDEIRFRAGRRVRVQLGGDRQVAEALRRAYPDGAEAPDEVALDLEADLSIEGEAMFDPFGGGPGSKDALDGFTRATPARAADAPALAAEVDPAEELPGEAILATDLAPADEAGTASRELTPQELAILDGLERMAAGDPPEAAVVKPAQAMAAVIRLLVRKRIVTEEELLDELRRK